MDKYLRKERNVVDVEIARRMVVVTNLLNGMTKAGKLPIPPEINLRHRKSVILEVIDDFIRSKK